MKRWVLHHLTCQGRTRIDARVAARFALAPTDQGKIEYCGTCDDWFPRPGFRLEEDTR